MARKARNTALAVAAIDAAPELLFVVVVFVAIVVAYYSVKGILPQLPQLPDWFLKSPFGALSDAVAQFWHDHFAATLPSGSGADGNGSSGGGFGGGGGGGF